VSSDRCAPGTPGILDVDVAGVIAEMRPKFPRILLRPWFGLSGGMKTGFAGRTAFESGTFSRAQRVPQLMPRCSCNSGTAGCRIEEHLTNLFVRRKSEGCLFRVASGLSS